MSIREEVETDKEDREYDKVRIDVVIEALVTLRSAERRISKMDVVEVEDPEGYKHKTIQPDPNILSYELNGAIQMLEEELEE